MAGSGLILRKGFINAVCFQCRSYSRFISRDDKIFRTGFASWRGICHTPTLCCNSKEAKLEYRPIIQPQLIRRGCNLRSEDVSQKVKISGWLQHKRHNGLFLILRDREDLVQVVVNDPLMVLSLRDLPVESVIEVIGTVQKRPKSKENEAMTTGSIEVIAEEIKILNRCNSKMPFNVHEFHEVREPLRLQYRYLDLRQPKLQRNLKLRSDLLFRMQEFFFENDFRYVETPTLFRKTPGGAKEFIVPTHDKGMAYTLPQSPQQFKQLLMVGAIERYVQVARCFRDETARPDRQPEFTQIDVEMSFIDQEDIKYMTEGMIIHSWPDHLKPLQTPFPRMDFRDAIRIYGSDKPDTRFDCLLQEVTDVFQFCQFPSLKKSFENRPEYSIQAVKFPHVSPYVSKKDVKKMEQLLESSFPQKSRAFFSIVRINEDGSWSGNLRELMGEVAYKRLSDRLQLRPGDVFILCSGLDRNSCLTAGKFRVEMASLLKEKGFSVYKEENMMNFLWVENFPLFLPKENGTEGLESAHHPFTAPHPDDEQLIYSNPEKVRGQHYDLVLNGVEVAGGSIRIHDSKLQRYVLQDVLKEDTSPLEHLIEALDCGCPPHGGIALGFDRYVSILCNAHSIRDVIAFPKSSEGKCLMSKAPSPITQEDKDYYHIDVKQ